MLVGTDFSPERAARQGDRDWPESLPAQHLAARGINTKPPGLHPADVPVAADLYRAGWSLVRIAEKFGTSGTTMRARLLEVGVRIRPRA